MFLGILFVGGHGAECGVTMLYAIDYMKHITIQSVEIDKLSQDELAVSYMLHINYTTKQILLELYLGRLYNIVYTCNDSESRYLELTPSSSNMSNTHAYVLCLEGPYDTTLTLQIDGLSDLSDYGIYPNDAEYQYGGLRVTLPLLCFYILRNDSVQTVCNNATMDNERIPKMSATSISVALMPNETAIYKIVTKNMTNHIFYTIHRYSTLYTIDNLVLLVGNSAVLEVDSLTTITEKEIALGYYQNGTFNPQYIEYVVPYQFSAVQYLQQAVSLELRHYYVIKFAKIKEHTAYVYYFSYYDDYCYYFIYYHQESNYSTYEVLFNAYRSPVQIIPTDFPISGFRHLNVDSVTEVDSNFNTIKTLPLDGDNVSVLENIQTWVNWCGDDGYLDFSFGSDGMLRTTGPLYGDTSLYALFDDRRNGGSLYIKNDYCAAQFGTRDEYKMYDCYEEYFANE